MKEMCIRVPQGSCPNCGHRQFVVYEQTQNLYLTDRDGEIIDSSEIDYCACGKCVSCGKVYNMIPMHEAFIPATKLREIFFDFSPHKYIEEKVPLIDNPMEVKNVR